MYTHTCVTNSAHEINSSNRKLNEVLHIWFYKYLNQRKYYFSHLINNTHSHLQEMKNTLNISLNHLIIPCKPPACSNTDTTTNPISNITIIEFYKYINQRKYYFSHLINNTRSQFKRMKNTPNISLNHLIIP